MQRATFGKRNPPPQASTKSDNIQPFPMALVALASAAVIGVAVAGSATVFSPTTEESASDQRLWVTSQRLARHTCPSSTAGCEFPDLSTLLAPMGAAITSIRATTNATATTA